MPTPTADPRVSFSFEGFPDNVLEKQHLVLTLTGDTDEFQCVTDRIRAIGKAARVANLQGEWQEKCYAELMVVTDQGLPMLTAPRPVQAILVICADGHARVDVACTHFSGATLLNIVWRGDVSSLKKKLGIDDSTSPSP